MVLSLLCRLISGVANGLIGSQTNDWHYYYYYYYYYYY